eukprot:m.129860 g.129860  ORF g.129860 m.129860 type:complete len:822 (-) comp13052_c0_seq8:2656-5121(-)
MLLKSFPSLSLNTKTISWVMLVTSSFFLMFMWFRKGIFRVWDFVGIDPSHIVKHARADAGDSLATDDRDQFALIAAVSHTVILLLGMVVFPIIKFTLVKVLGIAHQRWIGLQLALLAVVLLGFALFTQSFFGNAFREQHQFAHRWARGFFYEEGHLHFSIVASISYSICLLCGYFLKLSTEKSRFSAFPRCYRRWIWKIISIFITSLFFFRLVAIPLWKTIGRRVLPVDVDDKDVSEKFVTVATVSHTIALLGGMLTSSISWLTWKFCWPTTTATPKPSENKPLSASPIFSSTSKVTKTKYHAHRAQKLRNRAAASAPTITLSTRKKHTRIQERPWWKFVFATLLVWVVASIGILILYFTTKSSVVVLRQHIATYPITAIIVSTISWFLWGYLLIADKLPSAINAFVYIGLKPLELTRGRKDSRVRKLWQFLAVYCLYNLQIFVASTIVITFALARFYPEHVILFWVLVASRYAKTYRNHPAITGCRMDKELLSHWIFDEIADYFSLSIVSLAPPSMFRRNSRYMFCHHPHGVLPLSCGFIPHSSQWKKAFNNICPVAVSSSVLHHVPLMRDFLQLMGAGDVSKGGIAATLKRHDSIVLIPGGQQELLTASSTSTKLSVCTKHKGFIRLAYQLSSASDQDMYIVPMYNFGEESILDNAQAPMSWQKYSVDKLRANVFFLPLGYWNLPGVTRKERMTTAVAAPILVPRIECPSEAEVKLLHRRYFTALRDIFEKVKEEAGHANKELVFDEPVEHLSLESWMEATTTMNTQRAKHEDVDEMFSGAGDLLERIATGVFWIVVIGGILGHAYISLEQGIWGALFE